MGLAPHITAAQRLLALEQALQATMVLEDEWEQLRALLYLVPLASENRQLLESTLIAIMNLLQTFKHRSNISIISTIYDQKVSVSPIGSPVILSYIAASIQEIFEQWRWV